MVKGDSKSTFIALGILGGTILFGHLNSLFESATIIMLVYGLVTLTGGLLHQLNGEWGIVNLAIGSFGILLIFIWVMIDMMASIHMLSASMETFLRSFWYGFSSIMIGGLSFIIVKFQMGM